jgi:hypothetical protein
MALAELFQSEQRLLSIINHFIMIASGSPIQISRTAIQETTDQISRTLSNYFSTRKNKEKETPAQQFSNRYNKTTAALEPPPALPLTQTLGSNFPTSSNQ